MTSLLYQWVEGVSAGTARAHQVYAAVATVGAVPTARCSWVVRVAAVVQGQPDGPVCEVCAQLDDRFP